MAACGELMAATTPVARTGEDMNKITQLSPATLSRLVGGDFVAQVRPGESDPRCDSEDVSGASVEQRWTHRSGNTAWRSAAELLAVVAR